MAEVIVPNEVKRLICKYLDLDSIKNVRQVSSSWAAVGCELLLLPSFGVKSYSVDIPRLITIGSSPELSRQAARIVKTISFRSIDWDPRYIRRSIISNRQQHHRTYDISDSEATNQNEDALNELDAIIEQLQVDKIRADDVDTLALALRLVPQVDKICVECPNVFEHMVLRKAWDEQKLQTYRFSRLKNHSSQLVSLLLASRKAGLRIRHLQHSQLGSSFFIAQNDTLPNGLYPFLDGLQSLSLVIHDDPERNHEPIITGLEKVLSSLSSVESLLIQFATLTYQPLDLVQLPPSSRLHDLWLEGIYLDAPKIFSFLEQQGCAVRRLSISSSWLREAGVPNSWRAFLEDLRDKFGPQLRKFQLSGTNQGGRRGGRWQLWPIYKLNWTDEIRADHSEATRKIEEFVLRNGPWPMENDVLGFVLDG